MNKFQRTVFRTLPLVFSLFALTSFGQKETKTYKETFSVGKDAVIDINTSYTDIEFQTWDKDQVVVEATIELEGATAKEAEQYFKKGGVSILGNSKKIEISTHAENPVLFGNDFGDIVVNDFIIDIPEFPEIDPFILDFAIPDLHDMPEMIEMPPMPPVPIGSFDYEAYKKDGEAYMKKWKKEFDKNFNEDYKKRMEEWSERMHERSGEWKKRIEERKEEQQERMHEREEIIKQAHEARQQAMEAGKKALMQNRKALDSARIVFIDRDSLHNAPKIFFGSSKSGNKTYKVKKTIKIKMPKSAKLKMNVRHGEVKLAANTRNMDATLSYARLLAATIDGDQTNIVASYSPVSVASWDNGQLHTNFSEKVALKDVKSLRLSANSSQVTIDRLLKSANIVNNLGALRINTVSKDFQDLDISVQHGELNCVLPTAPYIISIDGTSSKLSSPAYLVWDRTNNKTNTVQKSYHLDKNSERSIIINSLFSDVVLEE